MNRKEELLKLAEEALEDYVSIHETDIPRPSEESWSYLTHSPICQSQSRSLYFCLLAAQLENP